MTIIATLLGIAGVLVGMAMIGNARHAGLREVTGATIMLTGVLIIPMAAVIAALG